MIKIRFIRDTSQLDVSARNRQALRGGTHHGPGKRSRPPEGPEGFSLDSFPQGPWYTGKECSGSSPRVSFPAPRRGEGAGGGGPRGPGTTKRRWPAGAGRRPSAQSGPQAISAERAGGAGQERKDKMAEILGYIGQKGWIGARHEGVLAVIPVVVIFADPISGRLTCREEIGCGRHRDHRRLPKAVYPTENDVRRALGLPQKPAFDEAAGQQIGMW